MKKDQYFSHLTIDEEQFFYADTKILSPFYAQGRLVVLKYNK
jgi:hypothetical protein